MNDGGHMYGVVGRIMRFNGGLFAQPTALPLDDHALRLLLVAAECNWADVEPAIFGTLLERALDARERHLLGAHFTPRAYVERLVKPTIEDPLRADWDVVQAHVRQLVTSSEGKSDKVAKAALKTAVEEVRAFHLKLCKTRVLDPACGSGNFLYVTLDLFKRLEGEVFALLESLGVTQTVLHLEGIRVTPEQFHGIEIKRWAKEIAELVLWIGYLQWHFRQYGKAIPVPEPVLRDYHNIECRDAVLAYDAEEMVKDETTGKPVTRWDGVTMKRSLVTGEDVPDEDARIPLYRYVNPRKAEWPEAEFIIGNPPFLGKLKLPMALGDGYVDALRAAYHGTVAESADYVMYWWQRAAEVVADRRARRFGLVSTNSITQVFNRRAVAAALEGTPPVRLLYALPDYPWVDDGAAVRVAMTVGGNEVGLATLATCETESGVGDEASVEVSEQLVQRLNADLSAGVDVGSAAKLASNDRLSHVGVGLHGQGFALSSQEADKLRTAAVQSGLPDAFRMIRPTLNGRDLMQSSRGVYFLDLFGKTEQEVGTLGAIYQWVLTRVKPERDQNRRELRRKRWWLFGENAPGMREAVAVLRRFIGTTLSAKHRVFQFIDPIVLPDQTIVVVASDDAGHLAVLSSRPHLLWAVAAGGRLGVGNDLRYLKATCFDMFPFPLPNLSAAERLRRLGELLDAHRKRQQAAHPDVTLTGMYNVLEKLRSGEALNEKDKIVHEHGLVSILRKIHDDLDVAVFDAYGWPHDLTDEQILERLVALNKERADEERRGLVRWLRPEFQHPGETKPAMKQEALSGTEEDAEDAPVAALAATPWPKKMPEQIAAVRDLVVKTNDEHGASDVARAFKGAKEKDVEEVLDGLAALGLLVSYELVEGKRWRAARFVG